MIRKMLKRLILWALQDEKAESDDVLPNLTPQIMDEWINGYRGG